MSLIVFVVFVYIYIYIYILSKNTGKFYRDVTEREYEKCRSDCFVFKGTNCCNGMLDHVLDFKGEAKKRLILKMLNTIHT